MVHTPHELAEGFPEHAAKIHDLKQNNAHFARLADEYREANREVHRIETGVEAAGQIREEDLRKRRIHLKDEIAAMLTSS